jgi:hypothetical protein
LELVVVVVPKDLEAASCYSKKMMDNSIAHSPPARYLHFAAFEIGMPAGK